MPDIISPMPIPVVEPTLFECRAEDTASIDRAAGHMKAGADQVLEPAAFEALAEMAPVLNTVGWVVVKDAFTEDFIEMLAPLQGNLNKTVHYSESTPSCEARILRAANAVVQPALRTFEELSQVGVTIPRTRQARVSGSMMTAVALGFTRHADSGDGHTFLANPLVNSGQIMQYRLGGKEDVAQLPVFSEKVITVQGRDLLVLGSQVLQGEKTFDDEGRKLPQYRTVTHGSTHAAYSNLVPASSRPKERVRIVSYARYGNTHQYNFREESGR